MMTFALVFINLSQNDEHCDGGGIYQFSSAVEQQVDHLLSDRIVPPRKIVRSVLLPCY